MHFTIRKIIPEEVGIVFELLQQLARHEKIEDKLKLTPDKMKDALFGAKADWHCLVSVSPENEIVAFALFCFANINRAFNHSPLIHIDDIFVKPEYRCMGLGKQLLKFIAEIAQISNIERIELWCLKDNDLGQSFYNQLSGRKMEHIDVYQLNVSSFFS